MGERHYISINLNKQHITKGIEIIPYHKQEKKYGKFRKRHLHDRN